MCFSRFNAGAQARPEPAGRGTSLGAHCWTALMLQLAIPASDARVFVALSFAVVDL